MEMATALQTALQTAMAMAMLMTLPMVMVMVMAPLPVERAMPMEAEEGLVVPRTPSSQ